MRPSARVQAAIEILDKVIEAARSQGAPADRILADWSRGNRYAGSKDRRAVREHVYAAIRACGEVPSSGRAAMLRVAEEEPELAALFDGSQYGPAAIAEGEAVADGGVAPEWIEDRLIAADIPEEEAAALLGRAPLDLRVNTLRADPDTLGLPEEAEQLQVPNALRLPAGTQVEQWPAFRDGLIEVQDAGSQTACLAVGAQPGELVIDLCAGAGGKTLSLAAAMRNEGTLIACDTDRGRLSRLAPRAERAGAEIADTVLMNPGKEMDALTGWVGQADAVLVDAPCSGTGTWRRNPEARWRLSPGELLRLVKLQERLLGIAAQLVKPGGRLVYVTCSLIDEEGAGQVDRFLAANPRFHTETLQLPLGRPRGKGIRLTPHHDGTDGFFIASLSCT
ncbi:RsmB/NOP family class I SAM-dependent RNA methyltransferase [Alteraurantiacibacter aquimixticola]|uniref:RsmB/NOP family class I SAM-dependent RNA methyltransferase n=1 Tax=Alteraurantiacibacter aquimixticola TaxID=2489173 RepID=A0A4T3F3Y5_9SPHN|nr:RsmB/NOP family class I SAM-dependent RNA methyltransferase [Alteraurantiacibacter aquimixticola]TIX50228.1 RsmB/NOP family class I SAM-dependent RNA methyltransferase [Alteraurantiacibacter aquimixticola]